MENSYLDILNQNKQIANIKECNLVTQKYGLVLSDNQIMNLLEKRKEALKNTGRVEFRGGILDKIIKAFCDSPYLNQENYASTLYELVDIFYEYKNETIDLVTDEELDIVSKIKRENLDEKSYLKTLIEEAYKSQMINNEDIKNMQIQIFELLDERVYKYNGTESSSIRKEIMEQINTSNYYTISLYLKTFKSPDDAVNMLKTKGLKEAYYSGIKRIDRLLNIIKVMYIKVKQNKPI